MDQFLDAKIRAEKRRAKRGLLWSALNQPPPVAGRESAPPAAIETPREKRPVVTVDVDVTIGEKVLSFAFDAPSFLGTVPASKITEDDLRGMVRVALAPHFGKLT